MAARLPVPFPDRGRHDGQVTINERIEAGRRERRVLVRGIPCCVAAEQAERERTWALVSAHGRDQYG